MTTDELVLEIGQLFDQELLPLVKEKNLDYAGFEDALSNFREFGSYGLLVRLGDKYSRVKNLMKKSRIYNGSVKNESIEDTIKDLANYCLILLVYMREEKMKDNASNCIC